MKTRVLIVGAGPSGAMAAWRFASRGFTDFIIVDRTDFPRQKPCAGGIAPAAERLLRRLGLWEMVETLAPSAVMRTLRLVGPDGSDNVFSGGLKARAVNRRIFDAALLDLARNAGARFIPNFLVRRLMADRQGRLRGVTDGARTIEAEVVIMATGGHNRAMRERFFPDRRPLRRMVSRIGWWHGFDLPEGRLEMIFDRELLPHYGWVFPEGDGTVNIGICVYEDAIAGENVAGVFDRFLDRYYGARLAGARQMGPLRSHPINTSGSVGPVAGNGMLLCGEAGRLCNPATAEGISFALESGYLAAQSVLDAYAGGGLDERRLYRYEGRCRSAFNMRLRAAALGSAVVKTRLFPWLIALGKNPLMRRIAERTMPL
ncbi:MAG: NAD(P)/FAD-dependent oxidoreductase [Spirochaetes bacterium]|nr:NAD(P)/FAD-dependent oxidoreductase [Spirochaetota bacterium]